MPAIHIRDVPEEVLAVLKQRAARHERSLQRELRQILTAVAQQEPAQDPLPPLDLFFSQLESDSPWNREDIYDEDGR